MSGGGLNYFCKNVGICMALRHAARGKATRFLGGFGACSPEKIFKNSVIWDVLENILLKFCKKKIVNIFIFCKKNNRECITTHTIVRGIGAYSPDFLSIVQCGVFWSTFSVKSQSTRKISFIVKVSTTQKSLNHHEKPQTLHLKFF